MSARAKPRYKLTLAQRRAVAAKRRKIPRNPRTMPIVGRGNYSTLAKAAALTKGNVRAGVGRRIGGNIGEAIQDIASLFGFGDYYVRKNSLLDGLKGTDPPAMRNTMVSTIVRHREYIQDIQGTTTFTNTSFNINPGLASSFPWLSQIAANYEEYEILGMVYEYKTLSTESINSTSTALGAVVMATEYNTLNSPFVNKQQMENYEFCSSAKPSLSIMHPVECDPHQSPITRLYTRTGAIPTGSDQRLYDLGNFQIATTGMQSGVANTVIGELWCTYEIQFYKPKLTTGLGLELLCDHVSITTAPSTSAYFGTTPVLSGNSSIGCTYTTATGVIQFPSFIEEGNFLLLIEYTGSSGTWSFPTVNATGLTIVSGLWVGGANNTYVNGPSTGTSMTYAAIWKVTSAAPKFTLSTGTFVSATAGDVWIMQVPSDIIN